MTNWFKPNEIPNANHEACQPIGSESTTQQGYFESIPVLAVDDLGSMEVVVAFAYYFEDESISARLRWELAGSGSDFTDDIVAWCYLPEFTGEFA